jgi:DNA (cytosine-5)-methyltransferase 1
VGIAEFAGRIGRVVSHEIEKTVKLIAETRKNYNQKAVQYNPSGEDSPPVFEDDRGRLMFAYGNLVNYFKPRWIVWENVPGVLSNNCGNDFKQFIKMLDEYGYGLAWRILDAQFFGVPQQRRRVFVIGYFRDVRRSASVLFDFGDSKKHIKQTSWTGSGADKGNFNRYSPIGKNDVICLMYDARRETIQIKRNLFGTLLASSSSNHPVVFQKNNNSIRKITPVEAERLQGFPDNWTKVPYRNKSADNCPDSPRYKAVGNSMAVPVMQWIGKRILLTENIFNERNHNEKQQRTPPENDNRNPC